VELLIVDTELEPVAPGQTGELLIGGPQVGGGYLSADEPGNRRFITKTYPGHSAQRWYRSCDGARATPQHGIVFQGRLDTQVKIRGNRLELEEVEHVVQTASHAALCAVVPWPLDEVGRATGLVAFVTLPQVEIAFVMRACRQRLPVYAVPQRIVVIDAFPLTVNGKIDRKALAGQCARGDVVA
jgi:non-ribosomal peptide synthetase component E (peptide arylation enzyme)